MKRRALFAVWCFATLVSAQERHCELSNNQSGATKEYVARDCISLKPGFSYAAAAGQSFVGRIDKTMIGTPDYTGVSGAVSNQPRELDKTLAVGSVGGAFDVSAMGAATCQVPIAVPQGINDMQPSLSLAYSSSAGDGVMGLGWSLTGLSAISRSGSTMYHDNLAMGVSFADTAPLSLDGVRLISTDDNQGLNATNFRTEIDNNYLITRQGDGFIVKTPDGKTFEYGISNDFRITLTRANGVQVVVSWLLNKVTDINGISIDYHYKNVPNTSETYLSAITYSNKKVQFIYSKRTDTWQGKVLDATISRTLLLERIELCADDAVTSSYDLKYSFENSISQLTEITQTNAQNEQYNATVFQWNPIRHGANNEVNYTAVSAMNFSEEGIEKILQGDFNGDGYGDLVVYRKTKTYDPYFMAYRNGMLDPYFATNNLKPGAFIRTLEFYKGGTNGLEYVSSTTLPTTSIRDGDLYDIADWCIQNYNISCQYAEPDFLTHFTNYLDEVSLVDAGDFDGDGVPEIIVAVNEYTVRDASEARGDIAIAICDFGHCIEHWEDGTCRETNVRDLFNEGEKRYYIYSLKTNSFTRANPSRMNDYDFVSDLLFDATFVDANQDGKADLRVKTTYYAGEYHSEFYTVNADFSGFTKISKNPTVWVESIYDGRWQLDFNGDGLIDTANTSTANKNSITNFYDPSSSVFIKKPNGEEEQFVFYKLTAGTTDFNGDGTGELITLTPNLTTTIRPYTNVFDEKGRYIPKDPPTKEYAVKSLKEGEAFVLKRPNMSDIVVLKKDTTHAMIGNLSYYGTLTLQEYLNLANRPYLTNQYYYYGIRDYENKNYNSYKYVVVAENNGFYVTVDDVNTVQVPVDDVNTGQVPYSADGNIFKMVVPPPPNLLEYVTAPRPVYRSYDMDGDGRLDLLRFTVPENSRDSIKFHSIWFRKGDNSLPIYEQKTMNDQPLGKHFQIGDFNGDGVIDVFDGKGTTYSFTPVTPGSRIVAITDGMNNRTDISYKPLSDPAVYQKEATEAAVYPVVSVNAPMYVADKVKFSTALTNASGQAVVDSVRYQYRNLLAHQQGRGVLGFEKIIVANNSTVQTQTFEVMPVGYTIALKNTEVRTLNGALISSAANTNTVTLLDSVRKIIRPAVTQTTQTDHLKGVTITKTMDCDPTTGLPTHILTQYGQTATETTDISYMAVGNAGNVRKPNTVTVTATRAGQPTVSTQTVYTYAPDGNLSTRTEIADTLHIVSTYADYSLGLPRTASKQYGNEPAVSSSSEYDNLGRLTATTNALGHTTRYAYNRTDAVVSKTDHTGLLSTYRYDGWGREKETLSPTGTSATASIAWTTAGANTPDNAVYHKTASLSDGTSGTIYYDRRGRELRTVTVDALGQTLITDKQYNVKGQLWRESLPHFTNETPRWTVYAYDVYGRPSTVSVNGYATTYAYNGLTATVTDFAGRTSSKTTDPLGNVLTATDPAGGIVNYTYNSMNKPVSISAAGGITTMTYDAAGNQLTLTDPDAGASTYRYNARGQVVRQTDARGHYVAIIYDPYGRPLLKEHADNTITYAYGALGQLLSETGTNSQSVTYEYDRFGRLTMENTRINGVNYPFRYEYDAFGNMTKKTYPSGYALSYIYLLGQLTEIRQSADNKLLWQLVAQNAVGQATRFRWGNGIETKHTYNYDGLLTEQKTGSVQRFGYSYDELLNIEQRRNELTGQYEDFSYDNLNRLTNFGENDVTYASNGNITYKTGVGAYQYSGVKPHAVTGITTPEGAIPLRNQRIEYNSFGKVKEIEEGNYLMQIDYGTDDQRGVSRLYHNGTLERTRTYIGSYELETKNGTTRQLHYIAAPTGLAGVYIISGNANTLYYIATDHLGSITTVVNESGTVAERHSYDAWGRERNPNNWTDYTVNTANHILYRGYTGHEMLPEFLLINMNGRVYDPILGRFLSPDNYIQDPLNPQNYNRYAYCLNNPMMYTDPTGEFWWLIPAMIIGGWLNMTVNAIITVNNGGCPGGWQLLGWFGVGALAAGVSAGVGAGVSSALAGGSFAAGFMGGTAVASTGAINTTITLGQSIMNGVVAGVTAGFAGGFISGAGNAWVNGAEFADGLAAGFLNGGVGGLAGGILGGIGGGLKYASEYHQTRSMIAFEPPSPYGHINSETVIPMDGGMLDGAIIYGSLKHSIKAAQFGKWAEFIGSPIVSAGAGLLNKTLSNLQSTFSLLNDSYKWLNNKISTDEMFVNTIMTTSIYATTSIPGAGTIIAGYQWGIWEFADYFSKYSITIDKFLVNPNNWGFYGTHNILQDILNFKSY